MVVFFVVSSFFISHNDTENEKKYFALYFVFFCSRSYKNDRSFKTKHKITAVERTCLQPPTTRMPLQVCNEQNLLVLEVEFHFGVHYFYVIRTVILILLKCVDVFVVCHSLTK